MSHGERWLHGGPPGLKPGQFLLPPAITGRESGAERALRWGIDVRAEGMEPDRHLSDRVYLTRELTHAREKAGAIALTGLGPYGTVYEAIPACPQPDPDFETDFPGLSVECPFALIVAIVQPQVILTPGQLERLVLRYMTFTKGTCPGCGHTDLPAEGCKCEQCPCWPNRVGVSWRWAR